MAELDFVVSSKILLHILPVPTVVPHLFTVGTDRNNSPQIPHLLEGGLELIDKYSLPFTIQKKLHMGLHPQQNFPVVKGLGDIIHSPRRKTLNFILYIRSGGNKDNRKLFIWILAPELLCYRETVAVGKHYIEEDNIGNLLFHSPVGLCRIRCKGKTVLLFP